MKFPRSLALLLFAVVLIVVALGVSRAFAQPEPEAFTRSGTYRGVTTVERFDISPPLRDITPVFSPDVAPREIPERATGLEGPLGPQDAHEDLQTLQTLQTESGLSMIPGPIVSFNGPPNISNVSPPDPVGDVGPDHYVAMSNLSFQIFDKAGNSLYGPAFNNTLWASFGGDCETDNAGDPIVLYDQIADRWMLSQFTASGPTYFNCVAVSTTPDPTGPYYRWAFSTGTNFPDYPKYGWWPDALYISTREFAGGSTFVGVGAYAVKRSDLISGNPAAQVIGFLVTPASAGGAYNIGDGILPSDLDGSTPPPVGSPNYFIGSMDNGGPYGAPQDALTLWKFTANFANPPASSFVLANTIPISAYDTIPAFCSGRSCVPEPGTTNKIDHLGYRQRPTHRLAYRNFGTHESLVTNQSVEASTTMSGIRWWEIRSPNSSPVLYQDATYAPGLQDGIHRWMGSVAMDGAGNMALGYSASSGTTTYPSSWYTGRLASDPLNTMPQGEGSIITGTGSQTGSQRWGDYTSINVDPVDDCTFWYVNEWVPTTSSIGWQLRIGAFKFNECGTPDFYLFVNPNSVDVCAPADASYTVNVGQVSGFTDPVTLGTTGTPAGATTNFSTNPVTPSGTSNLTVGTGAVAAGSYTFDVTGTSTTGAKNVPLGLNVFTAAPDTPTLLTPPNGALSVPAAPTFTWNAVAGASSYSIQVATGADFGNVVASASGLGSPTWTSNVTLNTSTTYYWRVRASNTCGSGTYSSPFMFTTVAAPGDCGPGTVPNILFTDGFEAGIGGWTSSGTGNTWAIATTNPHSGAQHVHANNPSVVSDQRLVSPAVALPSGQNPVVLKFWHVPNMEPSGTTACYDGGILEVSTDGGTTWTQLPNANLLVGPYRGTVSSSFGNPLAGLQAWCGTTDYMNTIADVSSYAGQTVQFRMRLGSDTSVSKPGWDVDDVTVQSCQQAGVPVPLEVTKTAAGEWDRTVTWTLDKSVDDDRHTGSAGDSFVSTWTVVADKTDSGPMNYRVTGTISIHNPATIPQSFTVTDVLDDGTVGAVDCDSVTAGNQADGTVPAGGTKVCSYVAHPTGSTATLNTAAVTAVGNPAQTATATVPWHENLTGYDSGTLSDPRFGYSGIISGDETKTFPETFTCSENPADYTNGSYSYTVTNWAYLNGNLNLSGSAQVRVTCYAPSLVTDTSRCLFDRAASLPGQEFRLLFTQDTQDWPSYKLTASNPGQFVYNVFATGTPGEKLTFDITLPYPFVTQGANPIHGYDGVSTYTNSSGQTCLLPGNAFYVDSQQVALGDYDQAYQTVNGGNSLGTVTIPVALDVPSTGFVFIAIHVDYGLKPSYIYNKDTNNNATDYRTGTIRVPHLADHTFSVSGAQEDDAVVENWNEFKKNPGVGGNGRMVDINGQPIVGATLTLKRGNTTITTGVTDEDGWYMLYYKHTGRAQTFRIIISNVPGRPGYTAYQDVEVRANSYKQVDFFVPPLL